MKYPRDPNAALTRPDAPLSLGERIWCAIIVTILVAGAVYVSVRLGR